MAHSGHEAAAEAHQQLGAGAGQHPPGQQASPGRARPQLDPLEQALALFCRATLHLCAGEAGAASDVIGQVNQLILPAAGGSAVLQKQVGAQPGCVAYAWSVSLLVNQQAATRRSALLRAHLCTAY